jgi:hypothetical protein
MGNEGMRIRVGLFDMKVSQLSNFQSDQGVYSGKGIINMPFSFQLACEFKEIRIDENQNLVSGKVNASTEGISNWIQDWLSDGGGGNTFFYSGSIDSVQVGVNGECIIYGSNGSMVITPDQYPFVITDSNSNSYLVNANGNLQLDNSFASMVIPDSVRKIYKLAILELKNEFSQNKINQLLNQKEQINSNFINGLEQKFSIQIQEDVENENVFLYPIQSQNSEWNGNENFNNSELAYITGLVIKIFSNRTLRETDYQLLAQGFEIKGRKSIDYIQSGISSGILDEVLVSETKQALKEFIRKVVEQKLED